MNDSINWRGIKIAVTQEARHKGKNADVDEALERLRGLTTICGTFSCSRKMLVRIGTRLLDKKLIILAPYCPDYSNANGRYTFRELHGGLSLLAKMHIDFLQKVVEILPDAKPILLVADLEAEDGEIRRAVHKTREEFSALVACTLQATRKAIVSFGWQAEFMTTFLPDLALQEKEIAKWISENKAFNQRIATETVDRAEMYRKIRNSFTTDEMIQRTVRTAAQYVAIGRYAHQQDFLICNHTTTNLSWYLQTGVAVLHNPISVY